MPLTPDMRRAIEQIRDYLYGGGYPDPVTNAEQLSFLFFFYLVEGIDAENVMKAKVLKQPYKSMFEGDWKLKNPLNAPAPNVTTIPRERFRWSVWAKGLSGEPLVRFVRDEVFAFFAELGENGAHNFMNGARLTIDEPTVLTQVVNLVDGLRLDQSDADTKGDLFEHVLKQIKQAGELGQFRTPRHIIRAIAEIIDPKIGETIYDPAAGTAGFLVAAYNHIRLVNSSPAAIQEVEIDGKIQRRGWGDKLSAPQLSALQTATFYGNDVDPKMVRLATMNLTLRGLPNVRILLRNVLTTTHKELRRQLIENNRVEAVLSLPGGVFQPYSGVKTSVLFFKRGGTTERVMFLHADNDGYKLDAQHDTPIDQADFPELIAAYQNKDEHWPEWETRDKATEWTNKWWFADAATLRANDFNLSAGRYRPMNHTTVEHRDPRELLDELAAIEAEIVEEVEALRTSLVEGTI